MTKELTPENAYPIPSEIIKSLQNKTRQIYLQYNCDMPVLSSGEFDLESVHQELIVSIFSEDDHDNRVKIGLMEIDKFHDISNLDDEDLSFVFDTDCDFDCLHDLYVDEPDALFKIDLDLVSVIYFIKKIELLPEARGLGIGSSVMKTIEKNFLQPNTLFALTPDSTKDGSSDDEAWTSRMQYDSFDSKAAKRSLQKHYHKMGFRTYTEDEDQILMLKYIDEFLCCGFT